MDPITLNLDPDPDFWSNLDPDLVLSYKFSGKNLKTILERKKCSLKKSCYKTKNILLPEELFCHLSL